MTISSDAPGAAKIGGWIAFCQALAATGDKQILAVSQTIPKGAIRDANSGR